MPDKYSAHSYFHSVESLIWKMDHTVIPSIPDSDAAGWLIAPAGRCVSYLASQMKMGGTLHRAVAAFACQGMLIEAARLYALGKGASVEPFDAILNEQAAFEPLARELMESDYHDVNVNVLIASWSALEVAVEDTIVLLLLKWPPTLTAFTDNGIDLKRYSATAQNEESAGKLVRALERKIRENFSAGPALVEMLRFAGLSVKCDEHNLERLTEMSAMRNCILHRGGVCDKRVIREASGIELHEGDLIRLGVNHTLRYLDAANKFAMELIRGATELLPDTIEGHSS